MALEGAGDIVLEEAQHTIGREAIAEQTAGAMNSRAQPMDP